MPDKDTYIEFEKHNTKLPCPFVIYGDFECLTTNSNTGIKGTYQEHKPCGYMLNVKGNEMKQHVQHAVLKQHAVTAKHWLKRMEKRDASCYSAWHLSATSSKGTTGLR